MKPTSERDYYTVAEVAEILNVSHSTVWRWIRAGKLRAYRVGSRNLRVRSRDLHRSGIEHRRPNRSLSLQEARRLVGIKPSAEERARRTELFAEIMRTRANRSIAPFTSDELVRISREKDSWYATNE
jgi:excisionase family DNA binding protein